MENKLEVGRIEFVPNPSEELKHLQDKIDSLDKKLAQVILELEIIKGVIIRL